MRADSTGRAKENNPSEDEGMNSQEGAQDLSPLPTALSLSKNG